LKATNKSPGNGKRAFVNILKKIRQVIIKIAADGKKYENPFLFINL